MDRFKFRVWNKDDETYEETTSFDCVCIDNYGQLRIYNYSDASEKLEDYTDGYIIEQCTGLKDKNGNLIYENDVLFDGEFCGQVIWKDGCWLVEMTLYDGDKSYEHLDQHFAKYGEIISNIHEQKDNK